MEFLKKYGLYLLVFFVAFAQYTNTFKHQYAWDDVIVITENSRVQKGLSNVPELFENIKTMKTEHRYGYRPITLLSFAAEVQFWGMSPKAGHVGNTIYYALLCVLILFFLRQLFPQREMEMLIITLLFAVHPLHTEVVANIKSRDEILVMLFGIAGLLQFRKFIHSYKVIPFLLALLAFLLAFLSKENAITFGGLAVLIVLFSSKTIGKKFWIASGASVGILGVLFAVRTFVYSKLFYEDHGPELAEKGVFHYEGFLGNPLFLVESKLTIIANSFYLIPLYIKQFLLPINLLHDYGYKQLEAVTWADPIVWFSVALFMAMLVLIYFEFKKRSSIAFGLLWFLITLSIYLHFVQIGTDIYAERFMFIPSLGLSIALVGAVFRIKKLSVSNRSWLFGAICLVFFMMSWKRNYAWKDNETLFTTDLPSLENCVRTNYNYAILLHGKYYNLPEHEKPKARQKILHYYEQAMKITDRMFNVYMDLGAAYMEFGYPKKALPIFEEACVKYDYISIPFLQMGKYHLSFEDFEKAIPYFEKAVEMGDKNSDFYYLLAVCKFNTDKIDEAVNVLVKGEIYVPVEAEYYSLLARAYNRSEQNKKAQETLERGLIRFPSDSDLQQLQRNLQMFARQ
ncbi:MAG: tetratricopeptide repeat protein [Flavobacteriales bacterium]|nr:tetratricopeptide repeat protein [Flavobacteriales bacterium]